MVGLLKDFLFYYHVKIIDIVQTVIFLSFFILEIHYSVTPNKPESVKLHVDKKLHFAQSSNTFSFK